jgi:hypothetical protein
LGYFSLLSHPLLNTRPDEIITVMRTRERKQGVAEVENGKRRHGGGVRRE